VFSILLGEFRLENSSAISILLFEGVPNDEGDLLDAGDIFNRIVSQSMRKSRICRFWLTILSGDIGTAFPGGTLGGVKTCASEEQIQRSDHFMAISCALSHLKLLVSQVEC